MQNRGFSKIVEILRKINGFGSPSRPKIAPRWPQARSRWPKIGPRRLQDGSKTVLKGIFSLLKIDFDFESFWDRFWLHFGSQNASLWRPSGGPNRSFLASNFTSFLHVVLRGSKRRPRGPKRPPRGAQEAPRGLQEVPKRPPRGPQKAPKSGQE